MLGHQNLSSQMHRKNTFFGLVIFRLEGGRKQNSTMLAPVKVCRVQYSSMCIFKVL